MNGARLLSMPEACDRLGIRRDLLYKLMHGGEITSVKIGARRLVPESAVVAYIERNEQAGVAR
jgi:excisionase family DNA binding protein